MEKLEEKFRTLKQGEKGVTSHYRKALKEEEMER